MPAQPRMLLAEVFDVLSQPDPYPHGATEAVKAAWIQREEAESALAGLISTALALGRIDAQALFEVRSLLQKTRTRVDEAQLSDALRILADHV